MKTFGSCVLCQIFKVSLFSNCFLFLSVSFNYFLNQYHLNLHKKVQLLEQSSVLRLVGGQGDELSDMLPYAKE